MPNGQPAYKSLTLDEAKLYSLSRNKAVVAAFPVLEQLAKVGPATGGGCSRCGRRKAAKRTLVYQAVKNSLANLSSAKRAQLKSLLSTHEVKIALGKGSTAVF